MKRLDTQKGPKMGRLIKVLMLLLIVGFIGLVGYAYLADFSPPQDAVTKPVVLDAGD